MLEYINNIDNYDIEYVISEITAIAITQDIKLLIDNIQENLYDTSDYFYFGNDRSPFLTKGETLVYSIKPYVINDLNDLYDFIQMGGAVHVYSNNVKVIDKHNCNLYFKYIKDKAVSNLDYIITYIIQYIESYIMLYSHPESDTVRHDMFGISNDIMLVNSSSIDYNDIKLYFINEMDMPDNVIDTLYRIYNIIFTEIYNVLNGGLNKLYYKLSTIRLKLVGTNIIIEEVQPPSSIRYSLNKIITNNITKDIKDNDMEDVIEDYLER